ncbi:hypothetical protein Val02_42750 [Virgisporangium aliadipatigenens]|uniref:Uncharacterized protein n=1 Tax=Virgisporangium aliadipatigenens TaxID=741659 RepID=A0A8J3YL39_9ACTN|nr:hypothetical protein Val02_42750 [Virgisporangium aliadipatigenens]
MIYDRRAAFTRTGIVRVDLAVAVPNLSGFAAIRPRHNCKIDEDRCARQGLSAAARLR